MKKEIICLDSAEGSFLLKIFNNCNWIRVYFKQKNKIHKIGAESIQFVFQSIHKLTNSKTQKNKSWLSSEDKTIFFGLTLAEGHHSLHIRYTDELAEIYFENAQAQIYNQIKITKFELENWEEILKAKLSTEK